MNKEIVFEGQYNLMQKIAECFGGDENYKVFVPEYENYKLEPEIIVSIVVALVGETGLIPLLINFFKSKAGKDNKCKIVVKNDKTIFKFKNMEGEEMNNVILAIKEFKDQK